MNPESLQTSPLVFYPLPNFAGNPQPVAHGQSGIVASSSTDWSLQSVSVGDTITHAYIWSGVDTSNPGRSYTGHTESYVSASVRDLTATYPASQYPLQYLGLDNTLAVPVTVMLSGPFSGADTLAATALVPGSTASQTTLAAPGIPGAMGFIGTVAGSSTLVTLTTGIYNDSNGQVAWSASGSLIMIWDGTALSFSSQTGLPAGWTFGTPVRQADGSWSVTLSEGAVSTGMDLYEEVSYQGTAQVLAEHDVATLRTPLGQWAAQSAKMNGLRLLSYTEYDPNDVSTDYRLYRDSYRVEDVPDLSVDYQAASRYIRGTALGENDVVVRVRLTPDDTTQRMVMSAFQRFPQLSGYATASLTVNGVAEEGVLVVFDKTQPVTTVAVQAGVLNEDGTADWQVSTTVRAVWSESRQEPLLTLDDNAPADWQFLSMQATGNAGEFTTLLTGAFPGSLHIESLTSDKASIADNGTDVATLTALVLDAQEVATEGVTVHWNTTSGILNVASSTTNVEGQASAQLSSTEDGTAVVTAQILGQDSKEITIQVTSQSLVVMGARSSNRSYGEYILSRLVAMDPVTSSPVIASWQYTDDMETYSGSSFTDIHPERELTVSAAGYLSVGLNVSNILGSGGWYDDDPGSSAAFSARKNDATVVAWGSPERGGVNPAGTDNKNVQGMCATASAFAAIRSDGSAFAWGNEDRGGVIPLNISERFDIVDLRSNRGTFLLRATSSPYIQTWGLGSTVVDDEFPDLDLSVPSNIAAMNDIVQLQMTEFAAAVVNSVGQVFAFGDASSGGAPDTTITGLSGITSCYSTLDAFAVLHGSGQIAAWGNENGGGDARVVMGYTDVMRLCGTQSAFLGLRKTGEIIAWGNSDEGGAIPAEYLELSNAVDIKSTYSAFAVLRSDGTVVCWGDEAHGGVTPSVNNVIAITGTSYSFAALRSDGTVYTWGDAVYGGDSSSVSASLKNVKTIYSNSRAFIALKNDNTVIVWGDTESGGSQGDVPATLNGYISYSF